MKRKKGGFWQVPGSSVPKGGTLRPPRGRWIHIGVASVGIVAGLILGAAILAEEDAVPVRLDTREVVDSGPVEDTFESDSVRVQFRQSEEDTFFGDGPPPDKVTAATSQGY